MKNLLYRGDCKLALDYLLNKGIKVDLIYLDPPFNSSRTYSMIFNHSGISGQQKAYHDMWDFTKRTQQLVLDFKNEMKQWELSEPFKQFMDAWLRILQQGNLEDRKLLNYLMYMTQRLIRMKEILKDSGSIYFHCDPKASHYIKVIMDGVFGRKNFINEIIWYYPNASRGKKKLANSHDVIFWYGKTKNYFFNRDKVLVPFRSSMTEWRYSKGGQAGKPMPKGKTPDDVIEMPSLNAMANERLGYQTQNPLALLKKLIETASHDGDIVMDIFCGCGTTVEAAYTLDRKWIGIDISGNAIDEIKGRIKTRCSERVEYDLIEGSPDTVKEYKRLNPYEKQEWFIRKLNGLPNPKLSGDGGVDGDMVIHLGKDKNKKDNWGKLIFSVKTGKQRGPGFNQRAYRNYAI